MSANSGDFKAPWSDCIKGENGETLSAVPIVGSLVTYGRFYQDSDAVTTGATAPQRWIVVNNDKNKLTLLASEVVVYGNYWGNKNGLNNYYRSTVRSWLNSGRSSVGNSGANDNTRNDGFGSTFSGSASQVNKGFLDVAFNAKEQKLLIPKTLTNMKYLNTSAQPVACTTTTGNTSINDLVWLPSYHEIYGTESTPWGVVLDGTNDTPFSYFTANAANSYKLSGATDYAWKGSSSYYDNGYGGAAGSQSLTYWWLRSPAHMYCQAAYIVYKDGKVNSNATYNSNIGVRPAVNVQL